MPFYTEGLCKWYGNSSEQVFLYHFLENKIEKRKKGSSYLLHNTLDQSINLRPKLAIFSLALPDLVGNSILNYEIIVDSKVLLDKWLDPFTSL